MYPFSTCIHTACKLAVNRLAIMDLSAIAAILVLIAAMVIPIFLLFRTQAGEKAKAVRARCRHANNGHRHRETFNRNRCRLVDGQCV